MVLVIIEYAYGGDFQNKIMGLDFNLILYNKKYFEISTSVSFINGFKVV